MQNVQASTESSFRYNRYSEAKLENRVLSPIHPQVVREDISTYNSESSGVSVSNGAGE